MSKAMDQLRAKPSADWTEDEMQEVAVIHRDMVFSGFRAPIGQDSEAFERGLRKGWLLGFMAALDEVKGMKQ
jgi:hypothetical protein